VKQDVHSKIGLDIGMWFRKKDPEIIETCKMILKNGFITLDEYEELTKTNPKSQDVLKGNLFQVEEDKVFFQNKATLDYVKSKLSELKDS